MSDTPRTDSLLTAILNLDGYVDQRNCPQRWVNHAREIERELNAANQRIKRLEEAGDRIVEAGWSVQDWSGMCVVWAKAKEAKP